VVKKGTNSRNLIVGRGEGLKKKEKKKWPKILKRYRFDFLRGLKKQERGGVIFQEI